jgi:hypothetical protein
MTQMAKLRYMLCAAALVALLISGTAKGAVEGVATLMIDNFELHVDTTGDGIADVALTAGPGGHITIISALYEASASADVVSIPGAAFNPSTGPSPSFLDTLIAQQGSAAPDDSLFTVVPTNLAAPVPHALADTFGQGSGILGQTDPITGLPIPFGADVYKTAQADLSTAPTTLDFGLSDASDTSTGSFTFNTAAPLTIIGIFDATRLLVSDLTPAPPGFSSSASISLSISITPAGVSAPIFVWTPDGVLGSGIVGPAGTTELGDPFSLNTTLATSPGSTASLSNTSFGNADFFGVRTTLAPGIYTVNIVETAGANVAALPAVEGIPEPSAFFVWAALVFCGVGSARRYRI